MTTKILALTHALGDLAAFGLMPGNCRDSVEVPLLMGNIAFDRLIAHKAFDSYALMSQLNDRGAQIVISQHPARAQDLKINRALYAWRHIIENVFCRLKAITYLAAGVIKFR